MEIEKSSRREDDEVEIIFKIIGPARPSRLKVPSRIKWSMLKLNASTLIDYRDYERRRQDLHAIIHFQVHDLRNLIASDGDLPIEHLKIVLRGETLHDNKNGNDVYIQLKDGDCFIVAVKPNPPAKHVRDGFDDDDDDDDLKFQIPQSASLWKRRLFSFLHDKLKLPHFLLMALFSISLKAWAIIILWFTLAPLAYRWDIGPLYILGTGFSIILLNLGQRQQGDLSAYSIFNEDFRELPGTLNADQIDRDVRAGQF